MELKFGENFKMYMEKEGSNRTFMELKSTKVLVNNGVNISSNRTFMELK